MFDIILRDVEGWLDPREAQLLYETASKADGLIVEIGSYRGRSTCILALAARNRTDDSMVYAIDPHTPADGMSYSSLDHAILMNNLVKLGLAQWVYLSNFASPDIAKIWKGSIGLLFIDGAHETVDRDFKAWAKHNPAYIALHDAETLDTVKAVVQAALDSGRWVEHARADNTVVLRMAE